MSASRPALEAVQALQLQSRCSLHSARLHTARRPGLCDAEALQRHHRLRVRAASASADDLPPAGCERVRLQLRKPLGLVLEMTKSGRCYIVDVLPSGSAAKDGRIVAGDELISTSALVFSRTEDYGVRGEATVGLAAPHSCAGRCGEEGDVSSPADVLRRDAGHNHSRHRDPSSACWQTAALCLYSLDAGVRARDDRYPEVRAPGQAEPLMKAAYYNQ